MRFRSLIDGIIILFLPNMFEFTKEKINGYLSIEDYHEYFENITKKEILEAPYNVEAYLMYTQANLKRSTKIRTKVNLDKKLYNELNEGIAGWTWILITEPWCGDASFTQAIIEAICLAGNIDLKIALRDKERDLMDAFLTNGNRSIPKLVVIDENFKEIFQWGPRPQELEEKVQNLLSSGGSKEEKLKLAHQWYNKYASVAVQQELLALIKKNKQGER